MVSTALSVGATAVVFAAVKSVLLNPLPYAHVDRLVQLRTEYKIAGPSHTDWIFWNDVQEVLRRTRTLKAVGIYGNAVFDLGGGSSPPEALYGLRVSSTLFPTLGVSPMFGRNILAEEDEVGHPEEIILSYGLWSRRFNRDRSIVGKNVRINGRDCRVIGVMPADFNFPLRRAAAHTPVPYVEFWAPLRTGGPAFTQGALGAVARLRPGVSIAEAQQDLASISDVLAQEFPKTNRDRTLHVSPLWDRTVGEARNALWFLMAAALMFLLIGCANVANLLLARGVVRQREISVRMAIGAGSGRIIRQLLTESCALALVGGLAGYALTIAAWKSLPSIAPVSIPRLAAARADWAILGFAITVALVTGILFGIAPALRAAAAASPIALHDFSTRGAPFARRDRIRASLVIGEVAISVVLVLIGGQLLGGFLNLMRTNPGFQGNRIVAFVVLPEDERYRTPEQRGAVYKRFFDSVRAIPGVESAGIVDALPFSGENRGGFISASSAAEIGPNSRLVAEVDVIGGDYLQTFGARLLAGRYFHEEEMEKRSETAIVNDLLATRLWPGTSAIGKKICVDCTPDNPNWKRVIGVVSSVRHGALNGPPPLNVYLASEAFEQAAFLVVRTERSPKELDKAVRRAIAKVDPDQAVLLSTSMESLVQDSVAGQRFIISLLSGTACLALLMSAAGVFGVISYMTSRRTQEIGIRMALGATPHSVHALVLRQGLSTVCTGVAIGLVLTLIFTRMLREMLAGLRTGSAADIWIAACVVTLVSATACWIPAWRATRIEPMCALRRD